MSRRRFFLLFVAAALLGGGCGQYLGTVAAVRDLQAAGMLR